MNHVRKAAGIRFLQKTPSDIQINASEFPACQIVSTGSHDEPYMASDWLALIAFVGWLGQVSA